jgi:hypothetical protein
MKTPKIKLAGPGFNRTPALASETMCFRSGY